MADTSWLDMVPGARAAYNYVVAKVSEFNIIGLQKIPAQQSALNSLGPRVMDSRDTNLITMYKLASDETSQLKSNWLTVEEKLRSFLSQIKSSGLGVLPVAALIALAGLAIVVSGTMYLFFKRAENHDELVRDFANSALERGLISAEEANRLINGATPGGWSDQFGDIAKFGLLLIAAVYIVPKLLPSQRRAA